LIGGVARRRLIDLNRLSVLISGAIIGTIVAMPVSGILAETAIGWKLIFYSISGILFVTAAIWYLAAANSPGDHPLMGGDERKYIEKGLNSGGPEVRNQARNRTFSELRPD
jgi:predicted permease